ncbi:MAG: T9SS type A sorting domain-containing protein [Flavobacteriaceae bacterium]|nr:T9SS type A sorting domain-containing protein [Flavobacteriaceae bacterium]
MKIKLFLLILLISVMSYAQYTAIPDANFEDALSAYDDIPNDGQVPTANINTLTSLDVETKNISDLTGIEDFTILMLLNCADNQLTSLDVTQNVNLEELNCSFNQLTSLDVTQNIALQVLSSRNNNKLTSLDVTQNVNLEELNCSFNQLTSLDVTQNINLEKLNCFFNQLTSLDVTQNINLEELNCSFNQLTSLDVTQNTVLSILILVLNQLTSLDIAQNVNLEGLNSSLNQLTSLDVTQNINLEWLICYNNQLTSLDVTQNINLKDLSCGFNELTSLYFAQNMNLESLNFDNNLLTSLDIRNGNNTAIIDFSAFNNPNLSCIFVDDAIYSTTNWTDIDASSTFVETEEVCDNVLSISDTAFDTSLSIYPNPTNNQVNIKTDRNANYMISSISGQILQKGILTQGTNILEISTLSQGVYFIKIKDNQTEVTQKLIIK